MIHALKCAPEYFKDVLSGKKTFEIRRNDRSFKVGDLIALNEYEVKNEAYTGASCLTYIDYILDNYQYCKDGYVILSIKPCSVYKSRGPQHMLSGPSDYSVPLAPCED